VRPDIVFRCDASASIGGGHVMRCLALADVLRRDGAECWFASASESFAAVPALRKSGHRCIELRYTGDAGELHDAVPEGCDWLVVDHYDWSVVQETPCRPWAGKILVIDDLANREHDCDLLLDQTFGRATADYKDLVPANCDLIVDSQYALLRPEFAAARPTSLADRQFNGVNNILVSMGLGDPLNATQTIIEGIIESRLALSVDVVLGPSAPGLSVVRKFVDHHRDVFSLHVATEDIAALMRKADLCFGAAGLTSWERCCLGLPTVLTVIAENQREICQNLTGSGAAIWLGLSEDLSPRIVADKLIEINEEPRELAEISRRSMAICDGRGINRVAMHIHPERATEDARIWLRPAIPNDVEVTYALQAQPGTRQFMRNPMLPTYEEHSAWFAARLRDPACLLSLIVRNGQEVVGSLRLDRLDVQSFEISVVIDPAFRGQGIGLAAISLAARLVPDAELWAEVLPGNDRSEALFTKAGFLPPGYGRRRRLAHGSAAQSRHSSRSIQ
jgi:UDP-2,4-diacetamido-2,4,6-trideoxy-beta-L-altropyranose hydrolase